MQITIEKVVNGGLGLGRTPDGKAVFVPFVLPGELVEVRPVQEKKGHMHAELVEVVQASEHRIQPFCKHFGVCGGCSYQMLSYADQLKTKQTIVMETLARAIGRLDLPIREIIASPVEIHYRSQMGFQILGSGKTGLVQSQSPDLMEIETCFLAQEPLLTLRDSMTLEDVTGLDWIDFRIGDEDPLVYFHGENTPPELEVDFPVNLLFEHDGTPMILSGDEFVIKTVSGIPFRVSADVHFPVNDVQTEKLVHVIQEALTPSTGGVLLDIYCGAGLFSAFAAPLFKEVVGIENYPIACEDFAVNLDAFNQVSLYQGTPEEVLPVLHAKPDVMIISPSYTGIDRFALDSILKLLPKRMIYVSEDLATLSRDLKRILEAGYSLESIQPMDMHPHTEHIDCVVVLNR